MSHIVSNFPWEILFDEFVYTDICFYDIFFICLECFRYDLKKSLKFILKLKKTIRCNKVWFDLNEFSKTDHRVCQKKYLWSRIHGKKVLYWQTQFAVINLHRSCGFKWMLLFVAELPLIRLEFYSSECSRRRVNLSSFFFPCVQHTLFLCGHV